MELSYLENKFGLVVIMMSTYNGDKYICEQLDSIIAQDYSNWILVIRDDGSTDTTKEVIQKYAVKLYHNT